MPLAEASAQSPHPGTGPIHKPGTVHHGWPEGLNEEIQHYYPPSPISARARITRNLRAPSFSVRGGNGDAIKLYDT